MCRVCSCRQRTELLCTVRMKNKCTECRQPLITDVNVTGFFRSYLTHIMRTHCVRVLLQHVHAFWGGGLVEAPHVVVHLREALLHVILGAALPHRPEAEAQGGMVQLRKPHMGGREGGDGGGGDEEKEGGDYHDGAHITFILAVNSPQGLGIWKVIILHK